MEEDSIANEDLFSDSFKIDEDGLFEHHANDQPMSVHLKSPLLQKTPHFMSRSRLPSITQTPCDSCSPRFY